MKKFLPLLLAMFAVKANAQQPDGKVFTVTTSTYADLSSPTVVTTQGWDDFDASVPLGFNFTMMGRTNDSLFFNSAYNEGADLFMDANPMANNTNAFSFGVDLLDRKTIATNSASTVSYKTETVSGKKIAKIQWKNVGFFGEYDVNTTLNDSANFQLWLYENNNDVEVRWGKRSMTQDPLDIFDFGEAFFGFVKNVNLNGPTLDWFYYVDNTSPASMDSIDLAGLTTLSGPIGFGSMYPAEGTVFKWAKPSTGVNGSVKLNDYASVYPTVVNSNCTVEISNANFKGQVNVIDMSGRVVRTQTAVAGKNNIDMSNLAAGTYTLNIRSANESVFYKITKL